MSKNVFAWRLSSGTRLAHGTIIVACTLLAPSLSSCRKDKTPNTVDTANRREDGGDQAATMDAATDAAAGTGAGHSTGGSVSTKVDAGKKLVRDAGTRRDAAAVEDSGRADECGGVHCGAPTVCDRDASIPHCVCPEGFDFSDTGGAGSPCVAHCEGDCDAG